MTEYEVTTLAIREVGLRIAAAHVAVGFIQAAVIWYGIRAMQRASNARAKEQDQRHAETMLALRELIQRTAAPAAD